MPARKIVRDRGMELFCAGTHPFAKWSAQKLTDAPRYAELIKRTQWWGRQMLIWGVHVHVGISSAHKVMAIITSLLNHYPHLLALSASSPYWDGEDTGYASNRAMMFQQLPTAGLPFHFQTWAEFEGFVHDQKKTGIIDHMNEIRWDIRPSPHLGTVEVRIFDGVSNIAELGALVALTHCLIVDLDRRLDAGEQLPTMPPWHVQENKWRAARYGLDAVIILDADSNERLVTEDLDDLLNRLEPVAKSLRCADELAGCPTSTARARPTSGSGGWPRRTTATCAPWSTRWSASWTSRGRADHTDVPAGGGDAARRGTAAADLRTAVRRTGFRLPGRRRPGVRCGADRGGPRGRRRDTRSDVGALAHITECADFGDGPLPARMCDGRADPGAGMAPRRPLPAGGDRDPWPDEPARPSTWTRSATSRTG